MLIGYARVSKPDGSQSLDRQRDSGGGRGRLRGVDPDGPPGGRPGTAPAFAAALAEVPGTA